MLLVSNSITVIPKVNHTWIIGAIALSYPPRVRVRAKVKLSAAFFNDESSITIGGGHESATAPDYLSSFLKIFAYQTSFQEDLDKSILSVHT